MNFAHFTVTRDLIRSFEVKEPGLYDVPTSIWDCDGRTIFICGELQPPQLDS
jgi:hypothetical protein